MNSPKRFSVTAILLLATVITSGCASTGSGASEIEASIPESAFEIHLYSDQGEEDYLGFIRRRLEMQGFEVAQFSTVDQNLATIPTDIGRQLSLAILVSVANDPDVGKTRAVFSGIQGRGQDPADLVGGARWSQTDDNLAFAFSRLAQIADRIDHDRLVYAVE